MLAARQAQLTHPCRKDTAYRAWLITICRGLIKRLVRWFSEAKRDLSREELLDELRLEDGKQHAYGRRQQTADEIFESLETAGQLQAAIDALPDDRRQIVTWHVNDRLSLAEIARRLGFSNDRVERTFKTCLRRLRQWFAHAA